MEEIFVVLLQFLGEILPALLELVLELFSFDAFEAPRWRRGDPTISKPSLRYVGYFVAGAIVGTVTLLVLPSTFLHTQMLRIANLFVAPIASALVAYFLATRRRPHNETTRPDRQFWKSFSFAFGLALVRYLYFS